MSNMGEYQPKRVQTGKNITQQWALRNMILSERKRWALDQRVRELLLSPKEGWRRMKWKLYAKEQRLKNGHLPERKGWTLYQRVSELLLSPKEGWRKMKWKFYAEVQCPEKRASSWEERLSSLLEGEWAVAESQWGMTQDEVKILCRGTTPWKTGIFLRGRVELFTGGWVSCCWVPKRDDVW